MDSIFLKDIDVWTRIGVPEAERQKQQRLLISIELFLDLKTTGESDDVHTSINYKDLTEAVVTLGDTERKTIERFAEDAAALILKQFRPQSVRVTVLKKPDLPLESASVTIVRP